MTKNIKDYAKEILKLEADAINSISEKIADSFEHAVHMIHGIQSHGHIIASGIGKGGIIAQKISATFASIGVPSFFLHPAEAVHGDIGRFTKLDLALVLSNSGETEEILRMIPAIKKIGCPLISITSTKECSLGKHSDLVIEIGKLEEAGPLSMAPTTSTTAMLAVGDALAMSVLSLRGLTKEQYAFYHPGGSLGRALLTVDEIMRTGDELCLVTQETNCADVLKKITSTKGRPGAALVIDDTGKLIGIFTDGDLRRLLTKGPEFLSMPVKDSMGKNPKSILTGKLMSEASRILTENSIDQLAVIDNSGKAIGLIDIQDVSRV
jgi:arabinose-5-phosphate isomerase